MQREKHNKPHIGNTDTGLKKNQTKFPPKRRFFLFLLKIYNS